MNEPDNLTLVLIGNLTDNDPWHLELWVRDDGNAKSSTARWYRTGTGDCGSLAVHRVSWDWLQDHAHEYSSNLTVLRPDPEV